MHRIKGNKGVINSWTGQPSKLRSKKSYLVILLLALAIVYIAYTNPESVNFILELVWPKQTEAVASSVGLASVSFPSSIKSGQNSTITLIFENSDDVRHNVSVYITPSIPGRLILYLGNDILSNNYTSWFYHKTLDPGEKSYLPIKVEGMLEPGEKSVTFDVSLTYSVDGVVSEEGVKSFTIKISS